ncbi:MAG TPA: hypothetical protein VNC78_02985 [Actinomycetota bacterium]|nr:hypothetical protein [Actinomycetota bacterium]
MDRTIGLLVAMIALVAAASAPLIFAPTVEESIDDPIRDLNFVGSNRRPDLRAIADIRTAEVRQEGDLLVFEAELSVEVPHEVKGGYYDVAWHVDGTTEWSLTVSIGHEVVGSYVSKSTGGGRSTVTGGFPGEVLVEGRLVTISIDPAQLADFPDAFRWKVTTRLNMGATDSRLAEVYDYAPNGRYANFRL